MRPHAAEVSPCVMPNGQRHPMYVNWSCCSQHRALNKEYLRLKEIARQLSRNEDLPYCYLSPLWFANNGAPEEFVRKVSNACSG